MKSLNPNEIDRLASELASFSRSDIPLPEGLRQLKESLPDGNLKTLITRAAESTSQGEPLHKALQDSDIEVPESFIALVRCGEISGNMTGVLEFAVKHGRRLKQYRSSTTTIMIYPLLVLVVLMAIIFFTSIFIVPRFVSIYDQLGAELPAASRMIVSVGGFFNTPAGYLVAFIFIAAMIAMVIAAATERIPNWMLDRLPGVRHLLYLSDTAIMTEYIGRLLERGVPLPDSCRAASLVVAQPEMRESLELMATVSEQGGESNPMLNPHIPATATWLYRQGEEKGNLADTCLSIAHYCENRFDLLSRRTLYMMEPLFILIVSVLCGLTVISFYLPLFNIPKLMGS